MTPDLPEHPDDAARRRLGLALLSVSLLIGSCLLCIFFVMPVVVGEAALFGYMCLGAGIALPAGAVYLTVPRLLDRYDPEPGRVLLGCVAWGGIASCGVAVAVNTIAEGVLTDLTNPEAAEAIATAVVAPIVEESLKGLGIVGVFHFLRREFDGLADGVIYACFVALGFAAVENIVYYARSASEGVGQLSTVLVMRGVIAPWGHPVYTSMTGLGLGFARESQGATVRFLAPIVGYLGAVALHATWNGGAVIAGALGDASGGAFFCFMLVLWLVFAGTFASIVVGLVRRRRRILASFLEEEVVLRFLGPHERDLVLDPRGLARARSAWGEPGEELVRTAARLAMAKYHAERARTSKTETISHQLIAPYRQRIRALRAQLPATPAR